jgi:uncharacterized protein
MTLDEIIHRLKLIPHPEGGYFRETYRSVIEAKTDPQRSASTAIYYLLLKNQQSAWHRVLYDEIYHFYCGSPLEVLLIDRNGLQKKHILGCDVLSGAEPQLIIPGGTWQSARCTGEFSLIGCTVSPGFDFADFEMADQQEMKSRFPHLDKWL